MQLKLPQINQKQDISINVRDSMTSNKTIFKQNNTIKVNDSRSRQTSVSINNSALQTSANIIDLDSHSQRSNQRSADNTPSQRQDVKNYVTKNNQHHISIGMKQAFAGRQQQNGQWQYIVPPLPSQSEQEQQHLKELVKFNIKFVDSVPKLRMRQRLKFCFIAIKALVRWIKFTKKLILKKNNNSQQYEQIMLDVKFNDQLKAIKFKQWTQMVFSKVINQVKLEKFDIKLNIDIIEVETKKKLSLQEYDSMVLKVQYLLKLFLEGLMLMTHTRIFLKELTSEMFASQFEEQRSSYFLFTSLRTLYLQNSREELPNTQRAMIFAEFIMMKILLPNIVILINQDKFVNISNPQMAFIIKLIFSFLHYLFQNLFYQLEFLKSQKRRKLIQKKISFTQTMEVLEVPFDKNSQDLLIGIYTYQQLKPLLEHKRWTQSMKNLFRSIIGNLEQNSFLIQNI